MQYTFSLHNIGGMGAGSRNAQLGAWWLVVDWMVVRNSIILGIPV